MVSETNVVKKLKKQNIYKCKKKNIKIYKNPKKSAFRRFYLHINVYLRYFTSSN